MRRRGELERFVRGLIAGEVGLPDGDRYVTATGRSAQAADIRVLVQSGALAGDAGECRAGPETAAWLKRAMIDGDAFQAQHRVDGVDREGRLVNLAESPLSRLVSGDRAFLEPHQIEAGERVRGLVERAQLRTRTTMNYSGEATGGRKQRNAAETVTDMAVDARRVLDGIHGALPAECAGVVMDVCGWLKGLQQVERERGWPRRSAKLVLRIGLEQVAQRMGLGPHAVGRERVPARGWMAEGARPELRT
jgi:hypothetical protein